MATATLSRDTLEAAAEATETTQVTAPSNLDRHEPVNYDVNGEPVIIDDHSSDEYRDF